MQRPTLRDNSDTSSFKEDYISTADTSGLQEEIRTESSSNAEEMNIHIKKNIFTVTLVNARSILAKLDSLNEYFNELYADVCLLTETWLKNEDRINMRLQDFEDEHGLAFLRKDRSGGRRGGGVAMCYRKSTIQLSPAKIPLSKHEIYAAIGRRQGQRREIAFLVAYVLPSYNAQQVRSFNNAVNGAIQAIKHKYQAPYIILRGDFNRRSVKDATIEHQDFRPISTAATRGTAVLDILATNMNDQLTDSGVTSPVYNQQEVESDHGTVFAQFRMPRVPSYEIQNYTYFHHTQEGDLAFGRWLATQDWTSIKRTDSPSDQVVELHKLLEEGMTKSYQRKTRVKKSSEPCWMTDWLRDMIEDRREIFKKRGRESPDWRSLKQKIKNIVKGRKKKYHDLYWTNLNKIRTRQTSTDMLTAC